jgi:hypothetical protein
MAVRQVVWLIILLVTMVWLACVLPGPEPVRSTAPDPLGPWRRTASGWENCNAWTPPAPPVNLPALHPLLAAALLFAAALGGSLIVESKHIRKTEIPVRHEGDRQKFFPFLSSDS